MRILAFILSSLILGFVVLFSSNHTDWRVVPICGIPALLFLLDEARRPKSIYDTFETIFEGVIVVIMFGTGAFGFAVLLAIAWRYIVRLF